MYLWIIATVVAFFIKGLCGFANTLVFTSIMGFGANNVNISPVELVLGYPSNIIVAWSYRKEIDHKVWIPLAALILAGCIPGALLLKNVNAQAIKLLFGFVIIFIGLEMLLREMSAKKVKQNKIVLGIIGFISGVLCGLFGIGALLAAYVSRVTDTPDAFKGNISAVFVVDNTFRIIFYTAIGVITWNSVKSAIMLIPFMLLGLFLGMQSSKVLDDKLVKKLVILLLIVSGIVLVARNLM